MNIIEKEAAYFYKWNFNDYRHSSLKSLKESISTKLYDFNRDRDKLDFLKVTRNIVEEDKRKHLQECQKPDCKYPEGKDLQLFVIDQEIDQINEYYVFEPIQKERFTPKEESDLHNKLNDIIEKLSRQEFGQEIIFNEIEDLKNHFNLGKKNWFQLLKGKLIELGLEKVLEETIIKEIFNSLSEGFSDVKKLLN